MSQYIKMYAGQQIETFANVFLGLQTSSINQCLLWSPISYLFSIFACNLPGKSWMKYEYQLYTVIYNILILPGKECILFLNSLRKHWTIQSLLSHTIKYPKQWGCLGHLIQLCSGAQ